jgi:hypothetical protein
MDLYSIESCILNHFSQIPEKRKEERKPLQSKGGAQLLASQRQRHFRVTYSYATIRKLQKLSMMINGSRKDYVRR